MMMMWNALVIAIVIAIIVVIAAHDPAESASTYLFFFPPLSIFILAQKCHSANTHLAQSFVRQPTPH